MASLYSEADLSKGSAIRQAVSREEASVTDSIVSAEGVALSLIRQFSDKQLPRASDLKWLVSEQDTPQEVNATRSPTCRKAVSNQFCVI